MSITSALKQILHTHVVMPLAGFIRAEDGAQKLDVVVSEIVGIDVLSAPVKDFFFEVAKGNVAGHSAILKFGENPEITSAAGFEDIWDGGGTYVPPTQARIHDIASSDINDAGTVLSSGTSTGGGANIMVDSGATFQSDGVAAGDYVLNDTDMLLGAIVAVGSETEITVARWANAGNGRTGVAMEAGKTYRVVTPASTGAAFFWVIGLSGGFLEQEEFVVLNGQNDVATVLEYIRQYRARVFGDGGSGGAEGVITSTAQVDGTVTCQIIDGINQTQMTIYTVPLDKDGYIEEWGASIGSKLNGFSDVHLRAGQLDGIGYVVDQGFLSSTGNSDFSNPDVVDPFIPGGSDIWIEADSSVAAGMAVKGRMQIILVDK